jgi:2-methylisocitrate lyase-like PEP mutase family enzyme
VLTARAENHLYGAADLADTLERLAAYRDAGADCLYAPGLVAADDIAAVVALGRPVNVLLWPGGPAVPELAALGVRRVSTGGRLAFVAYGALMAAARELLDAGTVSAPALSGRDRAAFG